jgi:transcription initiation factor TFIIIB Brf1 subunit/transcription initiation factor TFIIB
MERLEEITTKCKKYKVPQLIIDKAKVMYKIINECKHTKGKKKGTDIIIRDPNKQNVMAACVLKAYEKFEIPINNEDIGKIFSIDPKRVTDGCSFFDNLIADSKDLYLVENTKVLTPDKFIMKYHKEFAFDEDDLELSLRIAKNCCRLKIVSGNTPISVAAGSILLMVKCQKLDIDCRQISKIFEISEMTTNKIYKIMTTYKPALVNDELTEFIMKRRGIV